MLDGVSRKQLLYQRDVESQFTWQPVYGCSANVGAKSGYIENSNISILLRNLGR
jgi:hypothetical protein